MTPPQDSFWITRCAMLQQLRPFLLPSHSCLHSVDVVLCSALWIRHICLQVVAKGSFSEHSSLYFVLTLLMGKMFEIVRYGPHGGKLHLLSRGWYAYSTWTKQNLCFDHHDIGNYTAYRASLHDDWCLFHVRSPGFLETIISRLHVCWRMCCGWFTNTMFRLLCTSIDPCKETLNIAPTWRKTQDGWRLLQSAAIRSRCHLV